MKIHKEIIRDAISKIDKNDFIITVKKVVIPLSVIVRLNIPELKLKTTLPSFKKGIKIEIKNGIDNSKYPCKMELCISD